MKFPKTSLVSFKRLKFQKADTFCFLLQDCKLGKKGDIIQTSQETARKLLLPLQLAYYVPRVRGKPLLPENWEPTVDSRSIQLENIIPAFSNLNEDQVSQFLSQGSSQESKLTISRLESDSIIKIFSKTIPGTSKLFGSVGKEEIIEEIQQKFQDIQLNSNQITISGDMERIKECGTIPFKISIDQEQVEMVLQVLEKS